MKLVFLDGPQDGHVVEFLEGFDPKSLPPFISESSLLHKDGYELIALYGLGVRRRNAKVIKARFVGWHKRPLARVK